MDPVTIGIIGTIIFLTLLFMGLPVGLSMMFVGAVGVVALTSLEAAMQIVVNDILTQFSAYTLSVVPMFSLMGYVASYSGIGEGLFRLFNKCVGHIKGGLALAVQICCAIFGAICGSMPATVATFGTIAYPEMKKYGYDDSLSTASIAAGATISVLIPPSLWLIIYGTATETSVGKLFMAGIVAGILQMVLYMLAIYVTLKINPDLASVSKRYTWKERAEEVKNGALIEIFLVFLLSMGGLFIGWFTPTEAGAVGAAGMILITILQKKLNFEDFIDSIKDTVRLSTMIYLLLAGATVYGRFFTLSRIPFVLGNFISGMDVAPWIILIVIILIYLVLGMILDSMPLLLITIPIFYPIICGTLGYDPVWYGIIMVVVISMGSITPPVGVNVFILKGIVSEVPIGTIFRGIWPFVIANLIIAALLIFFPSIITFLPNLIYG